jgi:xanthine dehydrogenase molybdopterin-binding subunit B
MINAARQSLQMCLQGLAEQMALVRTVALSGGSNNNGDCTSEAVQPIHWQLHDLAAEQVSATPVQVVLDHVLQRALQDVILQSSLRAERLLTGFILGANTLHALRAF